MTESSVSISTTSAIVYSLSGLVFFLLAVILVMMGVTNCNWDCCESSCCNCCFKKKPVTEQPDPRLNWTIIDVEARKAAESIPPPASEPPRKLSCDGCDVKSAPRKLSCDSVIQMTF